MGHLFSLLPLPLHHSMAAHTIDLPARRRGVGVRAVLRRAGVDEAARAEERTDTDGQCALYPLSSVQIKAAIPHC